MLTAVRSGQTPAMKSVPWEFEVRKIPNLGCMLAGKMGETHREILVLKGSPNSTPFFWDLSYEWCEMVNFFSLPLFEMHDFEFLMGIICMVSSFESSGWLKQIDPSIWCRSHQNQYEHYLGINCDRLQTLQEPVWGLIWGTYAQRSKTYWFSWSWPLEVIQCFAHFVTSWPSP